MPAYVALCILEGIVVKVFAIREDVESAKLACQLDYEGIYTANEVANVIDPRDLVFRLNEDDETILSAVTCQSDFFYEIHRVDG